MSTDSTGRTTRRGRTQTRTEAQRVALELFTAQGYEATSLRQIAERLGINKASLYYHFASKEAILASLVQQRAEEADDLLAWVRAQPRSPQLVEEAVLRWVDASSEEKLRGIRFLAANPLLGRALASTGGERIGAGLTGLVDELQALLPDPAPDDVLLLRMALLSINAAVAAAAGTPASDEEVAAAAGAAARALLGRVSALRSTR